MKEKETQHETDEYGRPRALAPEKVVQPLEGERLNKLEQERIKHAQEEKDKNPEGKPRPAEAGPATAGQNHAKKETGHKKA